MLSNALIRIPIISYPMITEESVPAYLPFFRPGTSQTHSATSFAATFSPPSGSLYAALRLLFLLKGFGNMQFSR